LDYVTRNNLDGNGRKMEIEWLTKEGQDGSREEEKKKKNEGRRNVCTYRDASCEGIECGGFLTEELSGRHAALFVMLLRSVIHGRTQKQWSQ
jgi:hypothetical protein